MNEKKVVQKLFFVWDFEKEEKWLNEMADDGWMLESVGFCRYTFVPCEPGTYTIRLEMHDKDMKYIDGLEDTGAEFVGNVMSWLYFRKKKELGDFDLFSDCKERIAHLDRISKMLLCLGAANLCIGLGFFNLDSTLFVNFNIILAAVVMYGYARIQGKKVYLQDACQKNEKN